MMSSRRWPTPEPLKYHVHNESQTIEVAKKISSELSPGAVLALHGELGAGKSVFARAVMRALGVRDQALPSPTFAIIQEYEGRGCRLAHMDWYRLHGIDELEAIGVREYMQPPWVCLIEWSERAAKLLPPQAIHISLNYVTDDPDARMIEISPDPLS